jgi:propionyl-CoA synthetase
MNGPAAPTTSSASPAIACPLAPWKRFSRPIQTSPNAVVCAADELKGQIPLGLVVLKAGVNRDESIITAELIRLVRERIGPVAASKGAHVVARLPKTRSGKILCASIRRIADGVEAPVPPTIDDAAILDEIKAVLKPA